MGHDKMIKKLYRSRFSSFARLAYRQCYPKQPVPDNWHLEILADALEGCLRGRYRKLIINIAPCGLDTFYASIAFPVGALGRNPSLNIISVAV